MLSTWILANWLIEPGDGKYLLEINFFIINY